MLDRIFVLESFMGMAGRVHEDGRNKMRMQDLFESRRPSIWDRNAGWTVPDRKKGHAAARNRR